MPLLREYVNIHTYTCPHLLQHCYDEEHVLTRPPSLLPLSSPLCVLPLHGHCWHCYGADMTTAGGGDNRGVFASRTLDARQVVLAVPRALMLTLQVSVVALTSLSMLVCNK